MSFGSESGVDSQTMRGRDYPFIRQFTIFLENKIGQLMKITKLIESARLTVCALSVIESTETANIRLVTTQPERTYELLQSAGYAFAESDMLVVELPGRPQPLLAILSVLLTAEVNVSYCYPLLVRPYGRSAVGFYVDDLENATKVLDREGFIVLTEQDLESD